MLPHPLLDLPPPAPTTSKAGTAAADGNMYDILIKPNAKRLFLTVTLWSCLVALYSRVMESQGIDDSLQYGLWAYLSANLGGGLIVSTLTMSGWYVVASKVWRRSEAARNRYAQEGMYALLPWQVFLPLMLGLSVIGSALSYGCWITIMTWANAWTPVLQKNMNWASSAVLTLLHYTGIFTIDFFRVRANMLRIRAETAQRLNVEAQLQRLQAQMEPHMLFNTLANLHALIETQPAKAQDMLAHLIDYLRATLSASRTGAVSLRDEMARVQDYLALMQIRMGDRLLVVMDVPTALHEVQLPPMLIQPLVENAIKHGLDPLPEGGTLHILTKQDGDKLEITVRDDGQGLDASRAKPSDSGFGLNCIQARLQTCYGNDARLILEPGSQGATLPKPGTVAILRLPIHMLNLPGTSPVLTP
jgi:two-component sensor histidine kinase